MSSPPERQWLTTTRTSAAAGRCCDRLVVATVLGVPVLVMSMVPAAQFRYWQWVAFALATPVATWAAAPLPPSCVEERPPGRGVDGHAGVGRRARGLRVEHVRLVLHAGRRRRDEDVDGVDTEPQRHPSPVLRGGIGDRRPDPASAGTSRPGPSDAPVEPCAPCCDSVPRRRRSCFPPANRSSGRSTSCTSATRSSCCPANASPPMAWSKSGESAVDVSLLTGESVPVDVAAGTLGDRGDDQRLRPAHRPRHPGRLRDLARPDGQARRGSADRQGAGAAPRRSRRGRVRADRDRPGGRNTRVLAGPHRQLGRGVRPGGLGADHRLPVRAGSGHPDRTARRHRAEARSSDC